ncbi:FG-GAP repeat protein [Streptomyces thinghirensis]|nr:FG-GAP repeat protein [Streptomyces thinghirensis]
MSGTDVSHVAWDTTPILDEQLAAGDFDGDGHADLVFGLGSDKGLLKGPFGRDGTPAGTARVPAPAVPRRTWPTRTTATSSPGTSTVTASTTW